MVAERIRAPPHPLPAPAVPVPRLPAPAAPPPAAELPEPARARAAVGRREAAARRARVAVVDALRGVEVQVRARRLDDGRSGRRRDIVGLGGTAAPPRRRRRRLCWCGRRCAGSERARRVYGLCGGGARCWAEDVVDYDVDVPRAGGYVVVVEVIVSAHPWSFPRYGPELNSPSGSSSDYR